MAYQLTKDKDGLILFGHYPQSYKPADVLITDEPNRYGVCSGSDGYRYLYDVESDEFFRIEPIRWRVLREKDGKLLLLSDKVLDYRPFDEGGTNAYLWSDLCDWLTDDFFYDAFSPEERKHVLATSIKCDEESATPPAGAVSDEDLACNWAGAVDPRNAEPFKAKVFLLSVRNVTTAEFGFCADPYLSDPLRAAYKTDYAAASFRTSGDYAFWWLRSILPFSGSKARVVTPDGNLDDSSEVDLLCGIRPAIRIKVV